MKRAAKVRFIGDLDRYKKVGDSWRYDIILDRTIHFDEDGNSIEQGPIPSREIKVEGEPEDFAYRFLPGEIYPAYFLEYWQGKRESLHVVDALGERGHYIPLRDFEIVEDKDDVLNLKEAVIRCITHKFDEKLFGLSYGKEYIALGRCGRKDTKGGYLVMDESRDCYCYTQHYFEIVSDPYGLLDEDTGQYVYDWDQFEGG